MASPRFSSAEPRWQPSGFPPRSFPPGPAAPLPPPPPPPPPPGAGGQPARGWKWAVGAALLAVLLLAAALLLANRDDDGDEVTAGPSTTAVDTSIPTFDATTTLVAPLPSIDPISTTLAPASSTPAPPGALDAAPATLTLPRTDANAGASQGTVTLTNRGGTALTYTAQSSSPGLSVTPARGTINPGSSAPVAVTLDGARVQGEGPFSGTISFGGTGGTKAVQVSSLVGRAPEIGDGVGESCQGSLAPCSRHIKLQTSGATRSPCNTPWLYSVLISDQSRIQTARVIARRSGANADTALRHAGNNIFLSEPYDRLPTGTVLRFAIEAVDEHGFGRRLAEQTITC